MEDCKNNTFLQSTYSQNMIKYSLHPDYGLVVPPNYQVHSFNYRQIQSFFSQIGQKTRTLQQLQSFIDDFPSISIINPENQDDPTFYTDMIILHDLLAHIVQIHCLRYKQAKAKDNSKDFPSMRVQSKIATPLKFASELIQTKFGANTTITYLWKSLNDNYLTNPLGFTLQDFELKRYFTVTKEDQQMERMFFGGSIVGTFFMAKINQELFEINKTLNLQKNINDQEIEEKLKNIVALFKIIIRQNTKLLDSKRFNGKFFFTKLRPFLQSYQNIEFQTTKGNIELISSCGGSGGNDPLFQIFQRGLGLKFQNIYEVTQNLMKEGMYQKHRQFIIKMGEIQKLRDYCMNTNKLCKQYNNVLKVYIEFLSIHSLFIKNYIMQQFKKKQQINYHGTGGTVISHIEKRHEVVKDQLLKEQ